MAFLSVPNWDEFQHYKDRSPPWIKLPNELLDNYEFECLPDASKAHLLCIWLLASRLNNKINPDPEWIKRKTGANSKVDIDLLIKSGFLQLNQEDSDREQDASKALHIVEQSACLEGEESRGRVEGENTSLAAPNHVFDIYKYWCEVMGKSTGSTKLSPKRESKIKARLKDYSVEEIKLAIDNCRATPFNMGVNPNGKKYDDIELICRDAEHLESFRDNLTKPTETNKTAHQERVERSEKSFDYNHQMSHLEDL